MIAVIDIELEDAGVGELVHELRYGMPDRLYEDPCSRRAAEVACLVRFTDHLLVLGRKPLDGAIVERWEAAEPLDQLGFTPGRVRVLRCHSLP